MASGLTWLLQTHSHKLSCFYSPCPCLSQIKMPVPLHLKLLHQHSQFPLWESLCPSSHLGWLIWSTMNIKYHHLGWKRGQEIKEHFHLLLSLWWEHSGMFTWMLFPCLYVCTSVSYIIHANWVCSVTVIVSGRLNSRRSIQLIQMYCKSYYVAAETTAAPLFLYYNDKCDPLREK